MPPLSDEYVNRREFEALQLEVRAMRSDSTAIAVMSASFERQTRDLAALSDTVTKRFEAHEKGHETDQRERKSGRRWLITTAIAAIAVLVGLYGWMALLLHR